MNSLDVEKEELILRFRSLNDLRVLRAIRALLDNVRPKERAMPLASVFGSISETEARELEEIIRDGCEKVDGSQW